MWSFIWIEIMWRVIWHLDILNKLEVHTYERDSYEPEFLPACRLMGSGKDSFCLGRSFMKDGLSALKNSAILDLFAIMSSVFYVEYVAKIDLH